MAEAERVIAAAEASQRFVDADLADLLAFLDATGVRISGALAVLWADLDLDGDGIAVAAGLDPGRAWVRTGTHTITRVAGRGLVRSAHGETKGGERWLALDVAAAERLRARRKRVVSKFVFPNPLDQASPREVSHVTKRVRALLDATVGDDGHPMTWASSHSFRRTLVTAMHDAGVADRMIAGQTSHRRLAVLHDRYIARVPVSSLAADMRDTQRGHRNETRE